MKIRLALVLTLATLVSPAIQAGAADPPHGMFTPADIKWNDAPPSLPKGSKMAVLYGDPSKDGLFIIRAKLPANYRIPAHSHPTDENVVVVSGELFMGMGNRLDKKVGHGLGVGGFALMPANANHFAYTKAETTIVLFGRGPVEFKYVDANDDPRTKSGK